MDAKSSILCHVSMRTTQVYGKILPKRISNEMALLKIKMSSINVVSEQLVKNA